MILYAFDVDDTIEVSGGPITLQSMMDLRVAGHIVGLCGNWGLFVSYVPGWQHLLSFLNVGIDKAAFLQQLSQYVPADEHVMVGNIGPECAKAFSIEATGGSNDMLAAHLAGWRFIKEHDFAKGNR